MDDFDDIEDLEALEEIEDHEVNGEEVTREFFAMSDSQFVNNFWFSKTEVERFTDLLQDVVVGGRVHHSVEFQVLTTLGILEGIYFQRVGGLVAGGEEGGGPPPVFPASFTKPLFIKNDFIMSDIYAINKVKWNTNFYI